MQPRHWKRSLPDAEHRRVVHDHIPRVALLAARLDIVLADAAATASARSCRAPSRRWPPPCRCRCGRACSRIFPGRESCSSSMSGWLVKARAMRSFSPPMSLRVNTTGSRMPRWQDSQRSTMPASGLLICRISIGELFALFSNPCNCSAVRPLRWSVRYESTLLAQFGDGPQQCPPSRRAAGAFMSRRRLNSVSSWSKLNFARSSLPAALQRRQAELERPAFVLVEVRLHGAFSRLAATCAR